MKKLLLLLSLTILLFSCKGDEDEDCNCGRILSDNVEDYSVVIRSDCSGNEKRFTLAPGDWINAFVGSDYCITNSEGW
jgi:hypothetical protein